MAMWVNLPLTAGGSIGGDLVSKLNLDAKKAPVQALDQYRDSNNSCLPEENVFRLVNKYVYLQLEEEKKLFNERQVD